MRTFPGFSPSRCVSSFEQRALPPQFKDSTSKGSTCCSLTPSARNRSRSTCSKQQKRALCCALKLHRNQRTCHHLAVAPAAGCAVERQRLAHCLGQSALAYPRPLCQAPAGCACTAGPGRWSHLVLQARTPGVANPASHVQFASSAASQPACCLRHQPAITNKPPPLYNPSRLGAPLLHVARQSCLCGATADGPGLSYIGGWWSDLSHQRSVLKGPYLPAGRALRHTCTKRRGVHESCLCVALAT
jgi:hypothetical protein